ncbi:MAG: tetratricopeptide repeat protein [Elusimicrobiota bacterium]|nr:tetratricopeptide repeat protein [Elusimicrobiota bacterium]
MNKKISIYLMLLIFVSVGVYSNSVFNKFAFDDVHIVENNPLVNPVRNGVSRRNIFNRVKNTLCAAGLLFKSEYGAQTDFAGVKIYRPLVMVSYLLTNISSGNNPFRHHLWNVILQTINVILVFFLCKRLLTFFYRKEGFETEAFLCGLFFAVHPVHAEVVAGIVGRSEILAGLFCFVSFLFYIKNTKQTRNKPVISQSLNLLISVVCFFLALLSKENSAALLGLIFFYEILFNKKLSKSIIGFFGIFVFWLIVKYFAIGGIFTGSESYFKEGVVVRIFTMSKVMLFYIKLMFIPYPLNPDWGLSDVISISQTFFEPFVILSFIALVAVFFAAYKMIKTNPIFTFSILWFFAFLFPVSNIIPIGDFIAERFLYIPSFGFCLFAGDLIHRNKKLIKIASLVLVIFSFVTVKQNTVWKNNMSLWTYTTQKFPKNWRAFWELGKCYRTEKNADDTIKFFKKSLSLRETDLVLYDLAVELRKKGDCPSAIESLNILIGIDKRSAKAYLERAKCYGSLGNYKNAVSDFQTAALLSPKDDNIFYETGRFYILRDDLSSAKNNFKKAAELNGKNANALVGIGVCFYQTKNFKIAKNYFSAALRIDSHNMEAMYNLIVVNVSLGNKEEAKSLLEKYKNLNPDDPKISKRYEGLGGL